MPIPMPQHLRTQQRSSPGAIFSPTSWILRACLSTPSSPPVGAWLSCCPARCLSPRALWPAPGRVRWLCSWMPRHPMRIISRLSNRRAWMPYSLLAQPPHMAMYLYSRCRQQTRRMRRASISSWRRYRTHRRWMHRCTWCLPRVPRAPRRALWVRSVGCLR